MNSQKFCAPISSMISHALSHALAEASRPSSVDLPSMVMFFTSSHVARGSRLEHHVDEVGQQGQLFPVGQRPGGTQFGERMLPRLRLLM